MYKLSGHSLTRGTFFLPETQPMILQERDSSCTLQLSPDGPEIGFNDWILDDDWPEGNYVWRVKSLDDTVTSETRQIGLEHIIKILDDTSLFGEITTADIAGQAGASTVSAKQAVQYILGQQSDWVLGDFEYESVSNPYEFGGETLLDALGSVTETLEDAVWEYDLSVYPFKLHIRHRSGTVSCEMRGGRNLSTLKRSVNRSGMYTRIYPVGKNDLHLDSVYLSKNENVYGRVDKIETDQSKSTKENLQAWAQGRLNKHCEPTVSITISGLELSGETGESLDNLKLNKVCQCPLPEFNTTITERIVKKQWRDRRKEPENVTVNLCNSSADVATIIKEQSRGGGKGAAGQAKQNYLFEANENHLYYEVFDECGHLHSVLEMTTESLRIGFDNLIESTRSEFLMTSESLRIQFENEIASTRSQFEMTSESLRIQFENELASTRSELEMTSESLRIQFENEISSTRSAITATENAITAEVTRATGAESSLSGQISVEAGKINQIVTAVGADGEVTAASICLAINESGDSNATISADKIYLLGQTIANTITANYIASKISSIASLLVQNVTGETIEASTVKIRPAAGMGAVSVATGYNGSSLTLNGNTYTLRLAKFNGDYDEWTFSRAATLSAEWDGSRKFTVSASPQGVSRYTTLMSAIPNANVSWDGTLATIALKATIDDGETTVNVGNVTLDVANFLQEKTGTNKITANGLYSADSGYIGFGDIEIDVPQSTVEPTTLSMQWNGSRKLIANASPQGVSRYTTIVSAIPTSDISLSGTTLTLPLKATYDDGETTVSVGNITVNISNQLTAENNAGRAAVTLNDPTWNSASGAVTSRTVTVSTSGRKNTSGVTDNLSKSVALYLTQDAWSSNKKTVRMRTGSTSGTTYAQVEVDASSLVTSAGYAGRAAVTLNDPTWNTASGTPTSRTVTVTTAGRTDSSGAISNLSKSVALYLTQGGWSSNKLTVSMRQGSTSGTVIAATTVDASALVTTALNAGKAAVGITGANWDGSASTAASRSVSVSTTGRTNTSGAAANLTTSIGLYLTQGSWGGTNDSVKTVYLREGSASGTIRAQVTVDATGRYAAGWNANKNAWLAYGSLTSYQGVLSTDSFVKTVTNDINGNSVDNWRGGYWWVPGAWFVYADGAGSNHQGELASNSYIELVKTMPNGQAGQRTGATWHVPATGPSYSHSASLYCYEITTGSSGVKTCRFSVQYSATQSVPFSTGRSYSMHW